MSDRELRIKIGPDISKDFQIFIGEEDVTSKLMIKSVEMKAEGGDYLRVTLDCYADNIEIIPEEVVLRVEEWPPRTSLVQRILHKIGISS